MHEHFFALNLPLAASDTPERKWLALTPAYKQHHFLAGLLLSEVLDLLKSASTHRADAIHLLFDMLLW